MVVASVFAEVGQVLMRPFAVIGLIHFLPQSPVRQGLTNNASMMPFRLLL